MVLGGGVVVVAVREQGFWGRDEQRGWFWGSAVGQVGSYRVGRPIVGGSGGDRPFSGEMRVRVRV